MNDSNLLDAFSRVGDRDASNRGADRDKTISNRKSIPSTCVIYLVISADLVSIEIQKSADEGRDIIVGLPIGKNNCTYGYHLNCALTIDPFNVWVRIPNNEANKNRAWCFPIDIQGVFELE